VKETKRLYAAMQGFAIVFLPIQKGNGDG